MKTLFILLFPIIIYAQDRAVFNDKDSVNFFISGDSTLSEITDQPALFVGVKLGFSVKKVYFGLTLMGLANNTTRSSENLSLHMKMGYGGVTGGYDYSPIDLITLHGEMLFAIGSITYSEQTQITIETKDRVLVIRPAVYCYFHLLPTVDVAPGIGYRSIFFHNSTKIKASQIQYPLFMVSVRVFL